MPILSHNKKINLNNNVNTNNDQKDKKIWGNYHEFFNDNSRFNKNNCDTKKPHNYNEQASNNLQNKNISDKKWFPDSNRIQQQSPVKLGSGIVTLTPTKNNKKTVI